MALSTACRTVLEMIDRKVVTDVAGGGGGGGSHRR